VASADYNIYKKYQKILHLAKNAKKANLYNIELPKLSGNECNENIFLLQYTKKQQKIFA
jgi:hypothetical protein